MMVVNAEIRRKKNGEEDREEEEGEWEKAKEEGRI